MPKSQKNVVFDAIFIDFGIVPLIYLQLKKMKKIVLTFLIFFDI